MGELVDLDGHRYRLRDELAAELAEHGCVQRVVASWRFRSRHGAARLVRPGHALGRRVQTRSTGTIIWAGLADWPATPEEQARHRQGLHDAVSALPDLTNDLVVAGLRRRRR